MNETTGIALAEERERLYAFFSGICLQPPSKTLVDMIRDKSILTYFSNNANGTGFRELKHFVSEAAESPDLLNALIAEHSRLFKLPADVIPQEAFYLDKKKRLGGRVTTAVGDFYIAARAEVLQICVEMPDHIGIELQFMQFLCGLEKKLRVKSASVKLAQCMELQQRFLQEHLLRWAFDCCDKIISVAGMRYYKAMAYLLIAFLEDERRSLSPSSDEYNSNGEEP